MSEDVGQDIPAEEIAIESTEAEVAARTPAPVVLEGFNPAADLPHGLTTEHIQAAMNEFTSFLGFINQQVGTRGIARLESMLMPANFSSMVGEFVGATIPRYCPGLVKNRYHNGHPDLIPAGMYAEDAVQHGDEGVEIKGSRYLKSWQGHNPEDTWLMVFVFDSNRPVDPSKGVDPKPFRFLMVLGARLIKDDWKFAGRSEESRRTITASVEPSGYAKMMANWIYKDPEWLAAVEEESARKAEAKANEALARAAERERKKAEKVADRERKKAEKAAEREALKAGMVADQQHALRQSGQPALVFERKP